MVCDHRHLGLTLLLAIAGAAGGASAQTATLSAAPATDLVTAVRALPASSRPALDLSSLRTPAALSSTEAFESDQPRTAIDHQFASGGLVGSMGYLCGIDKFQPAANSGPASSSGRAGTFLGAKLSYAFK